MCEKVISGAHACSTDCADGDGSGVRSCPSPPAEPDGGCEPLPPHPPTPPPSPPFTPFLAQALEAHFSTLRPLGLSCDWQPYWDADDLWYLDHGPYTDVDCANHCLQFSHEIKQCTGFMTPETQSYCMLLLK